MKAFPINGGTDAGGPWITVGIFQDTVDPTAKNPDGTPTNLPFHEYTVRPTLDDIQAQPPLTPRQLFTSLMQQAVARAKQDTPSLTTKAGFAGALPTIPKVVVQF